jgi:hypothetical protein
MGVPGGNTDNDNRPMDKIRIYFAAEMFEAPCATLANYRPPGFPRNSAFASGATSTVVVPIFDSSMI